jgi:hypothetical protein
MTSTCPILLLSGSAGQCPEVILEATAGYFYDTFAYEICFYGIYFYRISFYGIYFYQALKFFSIDCTVVRNT